MNIITTLRPIFPTLFLCFLFLFNLNPAHSQTDIRISGPQSGFPVAVPELCFGGESEPEISDQIVGRISRNLAISGLFNVINKNAYIQGAQKCGAGQNIVFSDWSVIGAEGLVKGMVRKAGASSVAVELLLFDVQQQRAVIGKRYEATQDDLKRIADRFSNEIVRFFTGEEGIFGTQIAYVSKVGRFKELFIMNLDGTEVSQLTEDKGLVMTPAWAPSGDRIVFTSYKTRKPELYFIAPSGGEPRRITKLEGLELGAEFSRSGKELLTSATLLGVPNIVLMDLKGKLLQKVTLSSAIDVSPSFSPDNSQVVFCSNRSGGPQIYVTSAQGEKSQRARRISFTDSDYCTSPAWSPRGDKIAFVCRNRGHQIYLTSPDGSNTLQLTFSGFNEDPNWSPDGKFLVFSSDLGRGGPRNIAVMPISSGRATLLSKAKLEDGQPSWSPRME